MIRLRLFITILLTAIYIILCEDLSPMTISIGLVIGAACTYYCERTLPLDGTADLKLSLLLLYPAYIVWQVYLAGLAAIQLIVKGADVDIVEIKTQISDGFLRSMLANSITLTPGTISLDLQKDTITVLWLREKTETPRLPEDADAVGEQIKGQFERRLQKIQK